MITVEQALELISTSGFEPTASLNLPLKEALGFVLSENVESPINMPPFPQSAMDGYAVNYNESITEYRCIDEVAAGQPGGLALKPGEAVRIFTGAMVPETANRVIRQEDSSVTDGGVVFSAIPDAGANIRPVGEQIEEGNIALEKGTVLNAGAIGFLTTLGITNVDVFQFPDIAIVSTGNELTKVGEALQPGKIYESNSEMLRSACHQYGFNSINLWNLKDNYEETRSAVEQLITSNDVVIFSGGISVGDYDFVGKALSENQVEEIFYKIKQKPGKPLYFGKHGKTALFALPGNPAAALTCFYIYVLPVLNQLIGKGPNGLNKQKGELTEKYIKKGDRAQFLKAIYNGKLEILDGQSSAMLKSYAKANALVYIPADKNEVEESEQVDFYYL